jgi:hypothetical protein
MTTSGGRSRGRISECGSARTHVERSARMDRPALRGESQDIQIPADVLEIPFVKDGSPL